MRVSNEEPASIVRAGRDLRMALADSGLIAQRDSMRRRFCPSLSYGRHLAPPGPSARPAAVLIALELASFGWAIPLTVRPDHLPDHPGQISLPGGGLKHGESPLQAALREFREEVGVELAAADVVGELRPIYVFNSNYQVTPFVAVTSRRLEYVTCPHEVEKLVHLPVSVLVDEHARKVRRFVKRSLEWEATVIEHEELVIWGATAVILADLIPVLARCHLFNSP